MSQKVVLANFIMKLDLNFLFELLNLNSLTFRHSVNYPLGPVAIVIKVVGEVILFCFCHLTRFKAELRRFTALILRRLVDLQTFVGGSVSFRLELSSQRFNGMTRMEASQG